MDVKIITRDVKINVLINKMENMNVPVTKLVFLMMIRKLVVVSQSLYRSTKAEYGVSIAHSRQSMYIVTNACM